MYVRNNMLVFQNSFEQAVHLMRVSVTQAPKTIEASKFALRFMEMKLTAAGMRKSITEVTSEDVIGTLYVSPREKAARTAQLNANIERATREAELASEWLAFIAGYTD